MPLEPPLSPMDHPLVKHDLGRPNKPATDLAPVKPGRVRPYLRVRPETLTWLSSRGAGPEQRVAILVALLRDRYELPKSRRPRLRPEPEGGATFRPVLPSDLLEKLDAERGDHARGQLVDALVAVAAAAKHPSVPR